MEDNLEQTTNCPASSLDQVTFDSSSNQDGTCIKQLNADSSSSDHEMMNGDKNSCCNGTKMDVTSDLGIKEPSPSDCATNMELTDMLLTDLPMEIIVHIFNFISLHDRFNASMTCHTLNEAFNHPKLWHTQVISIIGDNANRQTYKFNSGIGDIPERTRNLITRFGKYFQFLTIRLNGFVGNLKDWSSVLIELSKQCRLEKLTLQIGKLITAADLRGRPPPPAEIQVLLSFIQNAFRMKHLDIKSWPLFPQTMAEEQNIFKSLMKNSKLKDLEKLDLFLPWKNQQWTERQPILPPAKLVFDLVHHLHNLQEVGMMSPMVSNELVLELSSPQRIGRMKCFKIFVTFAVGNVNFQIPLIKQSTWKRFVESNPRVQIECQVMTRVPNFELGNLLTLDCPLSKIEFLEWARLDEELLLSFINKFSRTLQSVCIYCECKEYDEVLIRLVENCKLIDSFIFNSSSKFGLHFSSIPKLAAAPGHDWKTFLIKSQNISFARRDLNQADDDDCVVVKDESGRFYLKDVLNYHSSNVEEIKNRRVKKRELKEEVEAILGPKFVNCCNPSLDPYAMGSWMIDMDKHNRAYMRKRFAMHIRTKQITISDSETEHDEDES